MADRRFNQFLGALQNGVRIITVRATIGALGAPTLDAKHSKGVESITRTGAGVYDILLQDLYNGLISCTAQVVTPAIANYLVGQVTVNTVSTAKTVTVTMHAAGVATDPQAGDELLVTLILRNSGT